MVHPGDTPPAYRRSTGSARGEARREALLTAVTDDLSENGLVDFSLRRAARAAGTTHKVLLYYFDGADDLLARAVTQLRERRIEAGVALATAGPAGRLLSDRVRALWPVLVGEQARVLDEAIGLAIYDPGRYEALGREATQHYLPHLIALCPTGWTPRRKDEVSRMILATLRGFLVDRRIGGDEDGAAAGLEALSRALDHEERSVR